MLQGVWVHYDIENYCDWTHEKAQKKSDEKSKSQARQARQANVGSDKRLLDGSHKWKSAKQLAVTSSLLSGRCSPACPFFPALAQWQNQVWNWVECAPQSEPLGSWGLVLCTWCDSGHLGSESELEIVNQIYRGEDLLIKLRVCSHTCSSLR